MRHITQLIIRNWFIWLIFGVAITLSFLHLNFLYTKQPQAQKQEQQASILFLRNNNFGQYEYLGLTEKQQLWLIHSKQPLKIGYSYNIIGKSQSFDPLDAEKGKYYLYYLTQGWQGTITIDANSQIEEQDDCNIFCQTLYNLNEWKSRAAISLDWSACHDNLALNQLLLGIEENKKCKYNSALQAGLILGIDKLQQTELKEQFKTLGLSHILVFSGLQVSLLFAFLESWSSRLYHNRWLKILLATLTFLTLIFIAGATPPVLRAGTSLLLSLFILKFLGRKISSWRLFLLVTILLLLLQPLLLFNISFQLSSLATLGILLAPKAGSLANQNQLNLPTLIKNIFTETLNIFWQSTFATLMTFPVIFSLNNQASLNLSSLPANILLLPVFNLLTYTSLLQLVPPLALIVSPLNNLILSLSQLVIADLSQFNFLQLSFPFSLQLSEIVAYYLFLGAVTIMLTKKGGIFGHNKKNNLKIN
jgi:ComEC/Rec2-related protein